jgi:hypothetical protein
MQKPEELFPMILSEISLPEYEFILSFLRCSLTGRGGFVDGQVRVLPGISAADDVVYLGKSGIF